MERTLFMVGNKECLVDETTKKVYNATGMHIGNMISRNLEIGMFGKFIATPEIRRKYAAKKEAKKRHEKELFEKEVQRQL